MNIIRHARACVTTSWGWDHICACEIACNMTQTSHTQNSICYLLYKYCKQKYDLYYNCDLSMSKRGGEIIWTDKILKIRILTIRRGELPSTIIYTDLNKLKVANKNNDI